MKRGLQPEEPEEIDAVRARCDQALTQEKAINGVKLGQDAKVFIDAEPKKAFLGKVIYISSIAEFTPKNVQTKEDRTKVDK
ncbi:MAG: hypothetical protein QME52_02375 [Bacteroidota bacterium]|nr:hypothetical protein [Bacteroidota bacterium]